MRDHRREVGQGRSALEHLLHRYEVRLDPHLLRQSVFDSVLEAEIEAHGLHELRRAEGLGNELLAELRGKVSWGAICNKQLRMDPARAAP